jgi:hypothetical protein
MKRILEILETKVKELENSIAENSLENCDDDEEPDWNQRVRDMSKRDRIIFAIKIIKENQKN